MALHPDIEVIFGDSPMTTLRWAKALIASQRDAFESEHKLAVDHGAAGEFGAMSWSTHADVMDGVHALLEVAEYIAKATRP